jgi:hypothetical protein
MKITEILVENQQVDEGPLLNKIGAGIGKAAGTVAKGIGAVAGGVVGAGKALAKGYQAGKSTVGGAGDDGEADTGAAPASNAASAGTTPTAKTAPKTKTTPAAGAAATSVPTSNAAPTSNAVPAASGTAYAQVKANIDKLDKKGKQRILATLQKEVGAAPAAKPAAPAAKPAANNAEAPADSGAMTNMAGQLAKAGASTKPNTMANTPTSKTNKAKPGNPNAGAAPAAEPAPPAPAAEPVAPTKPAAGATTTAPSGEKVLANPVATVGTKRATNIGQATFDKETGKALPGQALNAIRKKAEYGTGPLGAARKRIKAGAAAPAAQESIDADRRNIMGTSKPAKAREKVSESFSLFKKR